MNNGFKIFLTLILVGMLFIPVIGEIVALPVLAMIGAVWTIKA